MMNKSQVGTRDGEGGRGKEEVGRITFEGRGAEIVSYNTIDYGRKTVEGRPRETIKHQFNVGI